MRSKDYAKGFKYPVSKTEKLVVQDLADEILVYDLEKNKAYNLNQTSALVWQACDGKKDIDRIAAEIEKKLNQKISKDFVLLALDSLKKEGLVILPKKESLALENFNRREVVRRIGLASLIALPIVSSLVVPRAAAAASGLIPPACTQCVMKSNTSTACPAGCGPINGQCYNNGGCGMGGELVVTTCTDCLDNGMTPGGQSWVAI